MLYSQLLKINSFTIHSFSINKAIIDEAKEITPSWYENGKTTYDSIQDSIAVIFSREDKIHKSKTKSFQLLKWLQVPNSFFFRII